MRIPSFCLVALVLFAAAPIAGADYLEELRRGSSAQAAADLVKLAEWCAASKLYRSRIDLYELILELDTDHAIARRKLRFVKGNGGAWVRVRPLPDSRDRTTDLYVELSTKRKEIAAMYAAPVLAWLEKPGATTPDATRDRVLHEIFLLDPDHARARSANGEVREGARWILKESQEAAARRSALHARIHTVLAELPASKSIEPTKEEKDFGVDWKAALEGSTWRLLYAADAHEAPGCLRAADATEGVFEAVFGIGGEWFPGRRLLITDDPEKYQRILSRHPAMTKEAYEHSKDLGSSWLPHSRTCVCKQAFAEWRLEVSARQPFGLLLDQYFELTGRHGWVWEGVGLYLTHALTGYRRTTFVRTTRYAEDEKAKPQERLWGELLPVTADWFAIAADRVKRGETPDWKLMLAKDVNQMEVNDLLFSYMLAAYLIEGHAKLVPGILKEVGANKASADVLQAALGLPLARIEARVQRWIGEHGKG